MNPTTRQLDIRELVRPLLRRWWLIVAVVVVAAGLTYRHYKHEPTTYSASTLLYLQSSPATAILTGQQNSVATRAEQASDLAVLATSAPVARAVAHDIHYSGDPLTLTRQVAASPLGASKKGSAATSSQDFLTITATATTEAHAIQLANAFAHAFVRLQNTDSSRATADALKAAQAQLAKLPADTTTTPQDNTQRNNLQTTIQELEGLASTNSASGLHQIDPPVASASAPAPTRNAVFAGVIALVLVVALILALDRLDKRIRTVDEIADAYALDVIGLIPRVHRPSPVSADHGTMPARLREPFRRLRTVLTLAAAEQPIRTLLVTSASPREGKSTVARNLALAYREAGQRVLLVDSDLRKPALDRLLPVDREPGLADVLVGARTTGEALQATDALQPVTVSAQGLEELSQARSVAVAEADEWDERRAANGSEPHAGLDVLASGRAVSSPLELLSTPRMHAVLRELARAYDIVIIDTPPLARVSDAIALMSEVDAVMLVARPGTTRRDAAENVRGQLRRLSKVRVLGVVANRVPSTQFRAKGYGRSRRS